MRPRSTSLFVAVFRWDFWVFLSFPSDRSAFSTFCQRSAKNTAIAEKREENPEILTKLVRKRLTRERFFQTGFWKNRKPSPPQPFPNPSPTPPQPFPQPFPNPSLTPLEAPPSSSPGSQSSKTRFEIPDQCSLELMTRQKTQKMKFQEVSRDDSRILHPSLIVPK